MVAPVVAAGASMAGRAATLQASKLGAKKLAGKSARNLVSYNRSLGTTPRIAAPANNTLYAQNQRNASWKNTLSPMIQNLARQQKVELTEEELATIEEQYGDDLIAREQAVQEAQNEKEREAKKMQYVGAVIQALKQTKLSKLLDNSDPGIAKQVIEAIVGPGSMAEWPDGVTLWTWSSVMLAQGGLRISKLVFKSKDNPNYFTGLVSLLEGSYPSPTEPGSWALYFQTGLGGLALFVIFGLLSLFAGIIGLITYATYEGVSAIAGPLGPLLLSFIGL